MPDTLRLGLVGDNIALSQSPRLHRLAGALCALDVTFDLLVPRDEGLEFSPLFDGLAARGYRGVSVTYPYKERAMDKVTVCHGLARAIGAVNTVVFEDRQVLGFNTDHSGFVAAYRQARPGLPPGDVVLMGAGGVGRAVGFGLASLSATRLRLVDRDLGKAKDLAGALRKAFPAIGLDVGSDAAGMAAGASGFVNCTPVGMAGHAGTPLPRAAMSGGQWAFDAVYTPANTQFLQDARTLGMTTISGMALFFRQGSEAWRIYSNRTVDEARLHAAFVEGLEPA